MNRLKYLRESAGLTQLAVAESLGITPQAVSNYERGKNAVPCAYILQLARMYSVSAECLLGEYAGKTGRWLLTDAYPHKMYCSECFCTAVPNVEFLKQWGMEYEFCPHCGAPMKGVKK